MRHPAFDVARRADQVVLQAHLRQAPVAGLTQPVATDQFALRAFDGVALMHGLFERIGLLFPPPPLQVFVVLTHVERSVILVLPQALVLQRAILALFAPLEAEAHLSRCLLHQAAAVAAGLAGRADRCACGYIDISPSGRCNASFQPR